MSAHLWAISVLLEIVCLTAWSPLDVTSSSQKSVWGHASLLINEAASSGTTLPRLEGCPSGHCWLLGIDWHVCLKGLTFDHRLRGDAVAQCIVADGGRILSMPTLLGQQSE